MRIRFQVKNKAGEVIETSEWMEEHSREVSISAVRSLRDLHGPDAAISIERSAVEPTVNPTQVRFKIEDTEDRTFYTFLFPIGEKEQRLAEMREKFPKAKIEAQETR